MMATAESEPFQDAVTHCITAVNACKEAKGTLKLRIFELACVVAKSAGNELRFKDTDGRTWVAKAPADAAPIAIARLQLSCGEEAKDLLSLLGTSITPDKFRMYLGDGKEEYLRRHLSTCSEWQRLRAAGESTEEALTEQLCYASEKQDDAAPTPEQVGSAKDGKYHWPHRLWASLIKETSAKVIHVQQAAKAAARAAADAEAAAAAVAAAMAGASGSAGTSAPTTDNTAAAGAPAAARAGGAVIGSGGILMVPATALSQDPQDMDSNDGTEPRPVGQEDGNKNATAGVGAGGDGDEEGGEDGGEAAARRHLPDRQGRATRFNNSTALPMAGLRPVRQAKAGCGSNATGHQADNGAAGEGSAAGEGGGAEPDSAASGGNKRRRADGSQLQPTTSQPSAAPSGQLGSINSLTGKERDVVQGRLLHCADPPTLKQSVEDLGAGTTMVPGLKRAITAHQVTAAHSYVAENGAVPMRSPVIIGSASADRFDMGQGQRKELPLEHGAMHSILQEPQLLLQGFATETAESLGRSDSTLRAGMIAVDMQASGQGPAAAEPLHLSMPPGSRGLVIMTPLSGPMHVQVALRSNHFSKKWHKELLCYPEELVLSATPLFKVVRVLVEPGEVLVLDGSTFYAADEGVAGRPTVTLTYCIGEEDYDSRVWRVDFARAKFTEHFV